MSALKRVLGTLSLGFILGVSVGGCVVYKSASGVYSATPGTQFDRSWSAALGAFVDEGVLITEENRSTGTIRGSAGETLVTAQIAQQVDGTLRVDFDVSGAVASDASLKERIVGSYNRRMGR